jgi:molecular chaperone HscB
MTWDPFAVLGLPRRFDLDRATIEGAYLARAASVHPDLVGAGEGLVEADGDPASAELNRARQDLSDPETRASALVTLLGGPGKEQDRTLPDRFLMEMMDVREQMEAAKAADDREGLDRWERWAKEQRAGHMRAVGELFVGFDPQSPSTATLKAIRTRLNAWRYIERMLEQIA